jgi:F-type H+-transporting ATPase subunit b
MQIDWLTVVAQIVNFLVLVWLLKRFLYGPVVRVMTEREQRIAQRLDEASQREAQAVAAREDYQSRQAELERDREELLKAARDEVRAQRQALIEEAREEVAAQRAHWRDELARERDDFLKALRRQVAESAVLVARRALAGLSDVRLEAQAVRVFLRKLDELDDEARAALASGHGPVDVRSAFELDEGLREQVAEALRGIVGNRRPVHFRFHPDLLQGIELTSDGRRLSWSFSTFLDDVGGKLDAVLQAASLPGATGKS